MFSDYVLLQLMCWILLRLYSCNEIEKKTFELYQSIYVASILNTNAQLD
jgi:hypothetical protein